MYRLIFLFALLIPVQSWGQDEALALIRDGIELHDAGDYDAALMRYEQALELDPASAAAMYEIGYTYQAKGDYKAVQKWMKKVIKLDGRFISEAYQMLGSAQDDSGKPKKAIKTFRKGLELFPSDYLMYYNLALTYARLEEWQEVVDVLEEGIGFEPTHGSSLSLMAIAQENLGNRSQALLSAYLFLFLEPNSERSPELVDLTKRLILPDMEQDEEGNFNINLVLGEDQGFSVSDMTLSLVAFSLYEESNGELSVPEMFVGVNENFFEVLSEIREGKEGIWWEWFVYIFASVVESGHTEAFSYYIWQSEGGQIEEWLYSNEEKMEAFFGWIDSL